LQSCLRNLKLKGSRSIISRKFNEICNFQKMIIFKNNKKKVR
jgi:hypothetical protein